MKSGFHYLPLTLFLIIGYADGELVSKWIMAWKVSSVLAVLVLAINASNINTSNRIFLGVNIFLIIGGLLAWIGLSEWLAIYGGLFRGVSLFAVITLVGIITTLFSQRGYINIENIERLTVLKYSWTLLGVTVIASIISWVFRGNQALEGTLPFVLLYVASLILEKKARR